LYILGLFLIFPSVVSAAGRCCYYSYNEPSVSAGQDLICGYDDDGDGEDSPYHCQITSQGAQQCGSSLSWGDCPPANTFSSYYNFLGAHYTEHTTCPPITEFEDMAVYSHSILGSNAEGVCAYLQSDGEPDPSFGAMWTEAESKIITTGVHMVKCLCWNETGTAGAQDCHYEDAQLDFDASSQSENEFQEKYIEKCTSLNTGTTKCGGIKGYTKETSPADLTEMTTGQKCDVTVSSGSAEKGIIPASGNATEAADPVASLRGKIGGLNKLGTTDVSVFFGNLIKGGMGVLGSIALAIIVYGGVLWMTAAGNAEQQKKGMQAVTWAGLGIVIIFASYAIVDLVIEAFR